MVKILRWLQQPHGGTAWCLQPLPSSQMPRGLCKIPTWEHPGISPAQRASCRCCSVYVVLGRPQSIPLSFLPASIRGLLIGFVVPNAGSKVRFCLWLCGRCWETKGGRNNNNTKWSKETHVSYPKGARNASSAAVQRHWAEYVVRSFVWVRLCCSHLACGLCCQCKCTLDFFFGFLLMPFPEFPGNNGSRGNRMIDPILLLL